MTFLLLGMGCKTTPEIETKPLSASQLRRFLDKAKDPRLFWITVRGSNSGPVFEGAHRLHPNQVALMELTSPKDSSFPTIPFKTRSTKIYDALIDTSAQESWIDMETALAENAKPLGKPPYETVPLHVNHPLGGYLTLLDKAIFEGLHVERALFYVPPLQGPLIELSRGMEKPLVHVVLGYPILNQFRYFQIDYPNRMVVFSSTFPYEPNDILLIAKAPLVKQSRIAATEGSINQDKVRFILDTAGDFELIMPDDSTDVIKQLEIGDLVIRNVQPGRSTMHGLQSIPYPRIGRQILSRFKVTFDNRMNEVIFERPAVPAPR